jgi:hypothetical protein
MPILVADFRLSRAQLRTAQPIELVYVLMRGSSEWRFLVVPRMELLAIRSGYLEEARRRKGPGRRPAIDDDAAWDSFQLQIELNGRVAVGWGTPYASFLDRWPDSLPVVEGGPGAIGRCADRGATELSGQDPP